MLCVMERVEAVAQYAMQCLGWRADDMSICYEHETRDMRHVFRELCYLGAPVYRVWWGHRGEYHMELRQEWSLRPNTVQMEAM